MNTILIIILINKVIIKNKFKRNQKKLQTIYKLSINIYIYIN